MARRRRTRSRRRRYVARRPVARRRYSRRRRRNTAITPFIQPNPLILQNPRRRRRRNPRLFAGLTVRNVVNKIMYCGGGAGAGVGVNILLLNKIDDVLWRNVARVLAGVAAGTFVKGEFGAAMAGAIMAPSIQELTYYVTAPSETSADLETLAADLEEALDNVDELEI